MLGVSSLLVAGACIVYTGHVQRQAEERLTEQRLREQRAEQASERQTLEVVCAWLELRVDPEPRPVTPRGREQLHADQRLYEQFGCEGR